MVRLVLDSVLLIHLFGEKRDPYKRNSAVIK